MLVKTASATAVELTVQIDVSALWAYRPLIPQPSNLTLPKDGHPIVNSKGKLLKLALTLTRLSVQSSPQLLLKLSSQLSAARCTSKQVL